MKRKIDISFVLVKIIIDKLTNEFVAIFHLCKISFLVKQTTSMKYLIKDITKIWEKFYMS